MGEPTVCITKSYKGNRKGGVFLNKCMETAVVTASMKIMGKEGLLHTSVETMDQIEKGRPEDKALNIIGNAGGVIGHYYNDETQHVTFKKELNMDLGLKVIDKIVETIAGTIGSLEKYNAIVKGKLPKDF